MFRNSGEIYDWSHEAQSPSALPSGSLRRGVWEKEFPSLHHGVGRGPPNKSSPFLLLSSPLLYSPLHSSLPCSAGQNMSEIKKKKRNGRIEGNKL